MTVDVFSVPVFFIVFRETLEVSIIVAVLLAFLKQTLADPNLDAAVYKRLVRQVWMGVGVGVLISLIIAGAFIGVFYKLGRNHWAGTEYYWEGSFAILASVIITVMGATLLRISKMQAKWRVKLAKLMDGKVSTAQGLTGRFQFKRWSEKYVMFILPLVTVLREGIEAVVFIAGVSFSATATSIPLPVFIGIVAGSVVGYIIYKGGAASKLQLFLVVSTCLLYLVAAGLFSKGVWYFEAQKWNRQVGGDAAETGVGPGSYDITNSVWHVNCCSPYIEGGGGWGIFNGILGWQNSATYGSVISFNVYWIVIILFFLAMRYKEVKGNWPLMSSKKTLHETGSQDSVVAGSVSNSTGSEPADRKTPVKTTARTGTIDL